MQQKHHEKIFYLASAENKTNLYREKYASAGNETFTKCCLPKDENAVKFSHLIKHQTGHEKYNNVQLQ